jgi:hypothetical protein
MSILVVEIVSEGMIFGADRNITLSTADGRTQQDRPQRKVLRWPNERTLFGFVGAASINGQPIENWLQSIRPQFANCSGLEQIAQNLRTLIEAQRDADEGAGPAQGMLVHIGGFEQRDGFWLPHVWHITNTPRLGLYGYLDFSKNYTCIEHMYLNPPLKDIHPSELQRFLGVLAKQFQPFWFHQGLDLFTFNVLDSAIRSSFKLLCERHPDHTIPTSLEEWSKHVKMQVLMYGAYYEAFRPIGQRYVGGGADIEYLAWPS